jgi:hypothetical protein
VNSNAGTGRYLTTPRPRDVDGYDQAAAAGLTPQVPSDPPAVTVGPTARQALRDVARSGIGLVVALAAVLLIGGSDGRLSLPVVGILLGVAAVGTVVVLAAVRRWGRAQLAELQRGYTTTSFKLGRFWAGTAAPDGPVTLGWVEWKWDATWVLRPDGSVVSPPTGDTDPPGLYPSPRRPGALELWTGCQWSGHLPKGTGPR